MSMRNPARLTVPFEKQRGVARVLDGRSPTFYPRLALWAAFLRRFAADFADSVPGFERP
jgi:hypothetical protein